MQESLQVPPAFPLLTCLYAAYPPACFPLHAHPLTPQRDGGVSMSLGLPRIKGSFSASAGYTHTVESIEENCYSYYYVKATCSMYQLKTQMFTTLTRTDAFKNGVAFLDVDNEDTYYKFIGAFGTHYTRAVMIEGQRTKVDVFEESVVSSAENSGVSLDTMVKDRTIILPRRQMLGLRFIVGECLTTVTDHVLRRSTMRSRLHATCDAWR